MQFANSQQAPKGNQMKLQKENEKICCNQLISLNNCLSMCMESDGEEATAAEEMKKLKMPLTRNCCNITSSAMQLMLQMVF